MRSVNDKCDDEKFGKWQRKHSAYAFDLQFRPDYAHLLVSFALMPLSFFVRCMQLDTKMGRKCSCRFLERYDLGQFAPYEFLIHFILKILFCKVHSVFNLKTLTLGCLIDKCIY